MNESIDIEIVRAEALRKLGRNIINFSKIEAGYKLLLSRSKLEGPIETLSDQVVENEARLRKQTLGKLLQEFSETVLKDKDQVQREIDASNSEISFFFSVSNDRDILKARKQALENLVKERNNLIHHDLASLDPNLIEDYRKLIIYLDEQNPRLLAQLEDLGWMMENWNRGVKAFIELLDSPDFL